MIIAVDFDGVLSANGAWPETGAPNLTLIHWLSDMRQIGHKVILWTCRVGDALDNAVSFCKDYGLEFDAVNDNVPEIIQKFGINRRKVTADLYIDDKNEIMDFSFGESG